MAMPVPDDAGTETIMIRRKPVDRGAEMLDRFAASFGISSPAGADLRQRIEAIRAEIDARVERQINAILHHPEFQALESAWRNLLFLVSRAETSTTLKIRVFNIGKRELARTLRKFRGTAWDQSPIFRKIYEEEYGQFGGEPFGLLLGDYAFDNHPEDVQTLGDISAIAAAAHAPFLAAASPSVVQMDSWAELANPRDLTRIFQTPDYAAWRALRASEDARYLGLCLPRFLARLPYGARTDPAPGLAFEEDVSGAERDAMLWGNPAFAMAGNIMRAFALYGWCTRIRGADGGGIVDDLILYPFATADGATDLRCITEIAMSEKREAELARAGFIPLVHRKHAGTAAFLSAQSMQSPAEYDDTAATANAMISARLPYIFAASRFAHYLKCMVRDKVGSTMSRPELEEWLGNWLTGYVDGSPRTSSESWKAAHPLSEGRVQIDDVAGAPGRYEAKFFLRPHYQLEGLSVALRLLARLPSQAG